MGGVSRNFNIGGARPKRLALNHTSRTDSLPGLIRFLCYYVNISDRDVGPDTLGHVSRMDTTPPLHTKIEVDVKSRPIATKLENKSHNTTTKDPVTYPLIDHPPIHRQHSHYTPASEKYAFSVPWW